MKKYAWILLLIIALSCKEKQEKLPVLGNPEIKDGETVYPKIKDFSFTNQDSLIITNSTFEGKAYVADFIFLSCPTICPIMHTHMKSVYQHYKDNPDISFLSHTIDPDRDTVKRLKNFSGGKKLMAIGIL